MSNTGHVHTGSVTRVPCSSSSYESDQCRTVEEALRAHTSVILRDQRARRARAAELTELPKPLPRRARAAELTELPKALPRRARAAELTELPKPLPRARY